MSDIQKKFSLDEFIEVCLKYNEKNTVNIKDLECCPVHVYASQINRTCHNTVGGIKTCPVCGQAMCPECGNHNVTQLSRVTGYVQDINGWNAAKQQELKDRKRYTIGKGNYIL